jgi:hypothetical protein
MTTADPSPSIPALEQSIRAALDRYVFAPNDADTWAAATAMVSELLASRWPAGAYTVACGLGATMTPADILEGYMIVQVVLSLIRPAEFIELTFKQHMGGSGGDR